MFRNHFKIAWRNLFKNKTYSIINISGLTLGLAAFWLIVLYIADELSYDRYNANADRIVRVVQHTRWNGNDLHQVPTSPPFAGALKAAFPEIEATVRIDLEGGGVMSVNEKRIKQDDIIFADKSLLDIFSYDFLFGSSFALSRPHSIVITETLADKLFGSAEKAYNQVVYIDNTPNTVTAVIKDIPLNSHLRFSAARSFDDNYSGGWQNFGIYTYLLLKKGVKYKALEDRLPKFAQQTIQPIMHVSDYKLELQPLTSIHLHSALGYELSANGSIERVYMFIAIAVLILLIAIINYINLSTAHSSSRIKEIGVRKVIGSGTSNIAGMFITEAVLATIISSILAIYLAALMLPLFNQLAGKQLSVWRFGRLPTGLLLAGFSLLTGIISGIYPSWFLSKFKTIPALRGQMGNLSASIFFRKSLVVFQLVISVVMISCSILIYQQLHYATHSDLGFNKEQVLTFHIDDRNLRGQLPALKAALLQNPIIEGVAAAGNPIGNNDLGGMGYHFENEQGGFSTASVMAQELMIDADYLPTMDIRILRGRNFSEAIQSDQYGAALINETLLKKLNWEDPIGKRLTFRLEDSTVLERTIVGVIKDFHTYSLQHTIEPLVMVMPPAAITKDNLYVKIAKGKTAAGLAYLDKIFKQFDRANTPEYNFLNQNFARQYAAEERQGLIGLVFTVLAVIIACLGLFGLASFTALQRRKEIGVRKVLGASVFSIVQMLSKDFLQLVAIAAVISFPVAWFVMRKWLQDFAYRINISWTVFIISAVIAATIALLTISFQAIKAAVANPVTSLRTE